MSFECISELWKSRSAGRVGAAGVGLYMLMASWAADHGTDRVPLGIANRMSVGAPALHGGVWALVHVGWVTTLGPSGREELRLELVPGLESVLAIAPRSSVSVEACS